MKNNSLSINPIGLLQDFSDLFEEIGKLDSSSDNWFQQYKIKPYEGLLNLQFLNDITSDNFK